MMNKLIRPTTGGRIDFPFILKIDLNVVISNTKNKAQTNQKTVFAKNSGCYATLLNINKAYMLQN